MNDYYGLPVVKISNHLLEVVCLAETGPRIVGLFMKGTEGNLLAETPHSFEETPFGQVALRGGHRLWEAPELAGISGLPDARVQTNTISKGVQLAASPNAIGLQKTMDVTLEEKPNAIRILHSIVNQSQTTLYLAPWAITQLRLGGHVFAPLDTVPESRQKLPNRTVVLWAYSNWDHNGIHFSDKGLHFNPAKTTPPFKFGTFVSAGCARVEYEGYTFIKRFGADPSLPYPDSGCNLEIYLGHDCLEMETLSPLTHLRHQGRLTHTEVWEIEPARKPLV